MLRTDIIKLIKTLSATEKRYFRLSTKKHTVDRTYLTLFDLIDKTPFKDIEQLESKFREVHADASFENTARYLMKVVSDILVIMKAEKDGSFHQMQRMMKAKVYFERSLISEGLRELKKVRAMASESQNHLLEYMAQREELNVLSSLNFPDMTDDALIQEQTRGKLILKNMLQVHEHYSLYESLKYRLIYLGKTMSEKAKQNLNDLLLSELSIVTGKVSYNFESKKLHLSFQSLFFTSTGDYKSALKTFSELNTLYEAHPERLGSPPLDYIASLEGILDSLRTIGMFNEMGFYLDKIHRLIDDKHGELFNHRAVKSLFTYRLSLLTGQGRYSEALEFVLTRDDQLLKEAIISDYEKHCELLFYIGLSYFLNGQCEKALKYISRIAFLDRANHHFMIYKAARLLGIIIRYEIGDTDYLAYEIRGYKRVSGYKSENLQIEKLVFKMVSIDPNGNSVVQNRLSLKKLEPLINSIMTDKFELQVLKYFDLLGWINKKFATPGSKRKALRKAANA